MNEKLERILESETFQKLAIQVGGSGVLGAALGGIGRLTRHPDILYIPPLMDLFWGGINPISLIGYAIGASIPYADKVYPYVYHMIQTAIK